MEKRMGKVNISTAGGTAAKGAKTCKVTIPTTWLTAMGITEQQREVELTFDGTRIVIAPPVSMEQFESCALAQGHQVRIFRYYDRDTLCSEIVADYTAHDLRAENYTPQLIKTAFGKNTLPTWEDLNAFLEERCVPQQRAGLREYLETLGLDEYDPLAIIRKTRGRMAEDEQWLEVIEK